MSVMEKDYVVCPLIGRSLSKGGRLRRLSNVEEMLASTYGHFFRQVEQPYSCVEQEILTRIIKSLSSLLQEMCIRDRPRSEQQPGHHLAMP